MTPARIPCPECLAPCNGHTYHWSNCSRWQCAPVGGHANDPTNRYPVVGPGSRVTAHEDTARWAHTARAASEGWNHALCEVYGHDEVAGWQWEDGSCHTELPPAERERLAEVRRGRHGPNTLRLAEAEAVTSRAVNFCTRCQRVWR